MPHTRAVTHLALRNSSSSWQAVAGLSGLSEHARTRAGLKLGSSEETGHNAIAATPACFCSSKLYKCKCRGDDCSKMLVHRRRHSLYQKTISSAAPSPPSGQQSLAAVPAPTRLLQCRLRTALSSTDLSAQPLLIFRNQTCQGFQPPVRVPLPFCSRPPHLPNQGTPRLRQDPAPSL